MEGEKKSAVRRVIEWGVGAYGVLSGYRFTTIAGTLVFFLVMSLVPFTFWLTLLFGSAAIDAEMIAELGVFGWAQDLLPFLQSSAVDAGRGVGVVFLATTLWSSTGFFYHLRRSGEMIYAYRRKKDGWKVRLSAILLTFAVLLFFAVAGGILLIANLAARFVPVWIGHPFLYGLVLALGFFAAWILNFYVCPYRCRPRDTASGSFLTAVLWLIASAAFAVYLRFGNKAKLYGALALVVVFLLWLYWMMICFVVGAIFNRRRMETRGLKHKTL